MIRNHHRQAFVLVASQHGPMIVNRFDGVTIDASHGFGVGLSILEQGHHDLHEIEIIGGMLQFRAKHHGDGVMVLDCGANIGAHTISLARFMTGWGEVLAFEPQERVYYALAGNIALNNCFNARAFKAAIGETDGELRIPVLDHLANASFGSLELRPNPNNEPIGQPVNYDNGINVPVACIDTMNLSRVDLIKLDVEGMEIEALEGARKTVAKHKPILVIEMIKVNSADVLTYLTEYGYEHFAFGMNVLGVHCDDPVLGDIKAGMPANA